MLESTQHTKKIALTYDVINRQWFRVAYIILCNLQNINSQILPTKTPPGSFITDYEPKKRKKVKNSKHFSKHLLVILSEFSYIA